MKNLLKSVVVSKENACAPSKKQIANLSQKNCSSSNDSPTAKTISFTVPRAKAGLRLDRYLCEKLPWRSRTGIQKLIEEGKILRQPPGLDKELQVATRSALRLLAGETIIYEVPQTLQLEISDEVIPELEVLYEDEYLLAINKPPYMPVHPTARYRRGTLVDFLRARYQSKNPQNVFVPKLCHRLDRETSGLILAAKDDWVRSKIGKTFEGRKIEKEYLAIVEGVVKDDRGMIDFPLAIAKDSAVRIRMETRTDGKGLPCLTEYTVLQRFAKNSLVALKPKTGRQHQIRAHLASIGYPIVGDKIYGPDEQLFLRSLESNLSSQDLADLRLNRQALHAHRLRFEHPVLKQSIELIAPLYQDLRDFLARLSN